jgi:hypothetical protein
MQRCKDCVCGDSSTFLLLLRKVIDFGNLFVCVGSSVLFVEMWGFRSHSINYNFKKPLRRTEKCVECRVCVSLSSITFHRNSFSLR